MKLILHCNMNEPQWENSKEVVALGRGERVLFTLKLLCALWEDVCYKISSFIHRLKAWLKIPHTNSLANSVGRIFIYSHICVGLIFLYYILSVTYIFFFMTTPPLPCPPQKKPGKTLKLLSSDKKFFPAYHLLAGPR